MYHIRSYFGHEDVNSGRARATPGSSQKMRMKQDTSQVQSQAMLLHQTTQSLNLLDMYLGHVMEGDLDADMLSTMAASVNVAINMMSSAGKDFGERKDNRALKMSEGEIRKWEEQAYEKYGDCNEALEILETSTELMIRAMRGEEVDELPVEECSETTEARASSALSQTMASNHIVEKLQQDVDENAAEYARKHEALAREAEEMGEYHQRNVDASVLASKVRGKQVYGVDGDTAMRLSRRELEREQRKRMSMESGMMATDANGLPDLMGRRSSDDAAEKTARHVEWVNSLRKGAHVDAFCPIGGGIWVKAVIVDEDRTEGTKFQVRFADCDLTSVVSYGEICTSGMKTRSENVSIGKRRPIDEHVVAEAIGRCRSLHQHHGVGEAMDVDHSHQYQQEHHRARSARVARRQW